MKYAIELYYDKETEQKLFNLAKRVADEKLSTKFLEWKTRPHLGMMPVTASDKQTYQEKFAPEIAVRTSMADFKKEDKLVDLPLYAIEQIAEL